MRLLRGMFVALVATITLGAPGLGAASYGSIDTCCDHEHAHEHEHDHAHEHQADDPDGHDHADDASPTDRVSESCCATTCSACGCCGLGVSSGLPTRASRAEPHRSSTAILFALTHDPRVDLRSGVFRPPRAS